MSEKQLLISVDHSSFRVLLYLWSSAIQEVDPLDISPPLLWNQLPAQVQEADRTFHLFQFDFQFVILNWNPQGWISDSESQRFLAAAELAFKDGLPHV